MRRRVTDDTVLKLCIPSVFVVPRVKSPEPPPVPGTVDFKDVRPPVNPPAPFLTPWQPFARCHQGPDLPPIPCDVDKAELARFIERHRVEETVATVFKDRPEVAAEVMKTFASPFAGGDSEIVWTLIQAVKPNSSREDKLGGKKLKHRHKILLGPPWSIVSYGEEGAGVKRNVVYDGDGNAVAQVDFGHGNAAGIHVHALVLGNLEHTAGYTEDHAFPLHSVPWFWTCIPDVRRSEREDNGKEFFGLPATIDEMVWVPIDFPYEDFMGDKQFSTDC